MYISEEILGRLVDRFGAPEMASFSFEAGREEFEMIRASQKDGRSHDFTIYAVKGGQVIVNAKHFYQKGLFRGAVGRCQTR